MNKLDRAREVEIFRSDRHQQLIIELKTKGLSKQKLDRPKWKHRIPPKNFRFLIAEYN